VGSIKILFTGSIGGNPAPYAYYYSLDGGQYVLANDVGNSIIVTGLDVATSYVVRLVAQNSAGFTEPSLPVTRSTRPEGEVLEFTNTYVTPPVGNTERGSSLASARKAFINATTLTVYTTLPPEAQLEQMKLIQKFRASALGRLNGSDIVRKMRCDAIGRAAFSQPSAPFDVGGTNRSISAIKSVTSSRTATRTISSRPHYF
jgi:hypothetical protein